MPSAAGLVKRILRRLQPSIVDYLGHANRQHVVDQLLTIALQAHGYNNYHSHEESGEAHLVRTLKQVDALRTCMDVGANQGSFAKLLLENGADRVFAFEPHPAHGSSLQALLDHYPKRLSISETAVGATSGWADLFFNDSALSHASLAADVNLISYVNNNQATRVPVTSVDDFVAESALESVDFLKIDTEGYEHEVLVGASELLNHRPLKAVLLEFNQHQLVRGHSLLSLSEHLESFRCFQLLRGDAGVRPVKAQAPEANIFHYSNFVFVREDITEAFLERSRQPLR